MVERDSHPHSLGSTPRFAEPFCRTGSLS
jgi:hypothetical protein